MEEIKNVEVAKSLVAKYENITMEILRDNWEIKGSTTMCKLTGFGDNSTCCLCKAVHNVCDYCIHAMSLTMDTSYQCVENSYHDIASARNPRDCFDAIRNRVNYLKNLIYRYETEYRSS